MAYDTRMDIIAVIKLASLLLYPLGLVFLCAGLGLVCLLLGRRLAAKRLWIVGFVFLWVFATPQVAIELTASLESKFPPVAISQVSMHDAIVVMGGGLRLPSEPVDRVQFTHATDRYWLASKLYAAGKAPLVVLLGGNVFAQPGLAAESEYARDLLIEWGVPKEAIVIDTVSRTTEQNVEQFHILLNDAPRLAKSPLDVLLVTSALHMPRSEYIMRTALRNRVQLTPVAADVLIRSEQLPSFKYWVPDAGAINLATLAIHEVYGLWFMQLKNRLRNLI